MNGPTFHPLTMTINLTFIFHLLFHIYLVTILEIVSPSFVSKSSIPTSPLPLLQFTLIISLQIQGNSVLTHLPALTLPLSHSILGTTMVVVIKNFRILSERSENSENSHIPMGSYPNFCLLNIRMSLIILFRGGGFEKNLNEQLLSIAWYKNSQERNSPFYNITLLQQKSE